MEPKFLDLVGKTFASVESNGFYSESVDFIKCE